MASGKRYRDATKKYDREHLHSASEAIDIVLANATAKFDETIALIIRLGIDPRKSDQMVRGTVALPSGTGRDVPCKFNTPGAKQPGPARILCPQATSWSIFRGPPVTKWSMPSRRPKERRSAR